jgi:hypothetical protein
MTSDQKNRYEAIKKMAKEELEHLDMELSREVMRARQRIEELQKAKRVVRQIYDNACTLLEATGATEIMGDRPVELEKQA